jgi:hypothetical protein
MATDPKVRVTLVDDELIVTLPGSYYSVTYYKPEGLSPTARKEHRGQRRSTPPDDTG